MKLVDNITASARRAAVFQAYREGRAHAERVATEYTALEVPDHWCALCDALSRHCLSRDILLTSPALWAELTPFLLVPDEERAVTLLAEYVVYKVHAASADIEQLGLGINPALHRLDVTDRRVVAFLDDAMTVFRPDWLALLSYESFRWIRRALEAARHVPRDQRMEWCGRGGPLWLKRGPGEVESEAFGSLEG